MRRWRRRGKVSLTLLLTAVFVTFSLLPDLARPAYAAPASQQPSPQPATTSVESLPLSVPEDPLAQTRGQESPEIVIGVDVRDGHLTVRVVDIWGSGWTPLVVRSYTNAKQDAGYAPDSGAAPYAWRFNHLLDIVPTDASNPAADRFVLEPDGNREVYTGFSTRYNAARTERWTTYVKNVGTYSTMEMHEINCVDQEPGPTTCTWDGTHVVYLPKGITRRYQDSKIVEERDANGNVTTFAYTTFADGVGKYLSMVTDPVGRQMTYVWEHAFQKCVRYGGIDHDCLEVKWVYRVRSVTDPYGRVATYTYNASQQIVSVLNGAGFTTQYGYTGNLLTSVTNARGLTTAVQWIGTTPARVARVTPPTVTPPDSASTAYSYTGSPVTQTVVTDARGNATTYAVDANGNVTRITDPLTNATQFAYDSRHNVTQVTDARNNLTTYTYNTHNKVTQVVQDNTFVGLKLTTDLTWDSVDTLPYNGKDNLLSVTNPRRIRTEFTYDANNNLLSVKKAVGTADEALTQYTYTTWGGVASVTDPRLKTTTYAYTARRQVQTITLPAGGPTSFTYNAADDQVTMTDGNGRTWTTAYDARRLVTGIADPLNNTIRHEYNANGNRTRTYDPKNQPTTFVYDSRDRLVTITDPLNQSTSYQYDPVGNLARVTNARNSATNFTYDAANRLTQVTDALNQITTYGYDAAGNRTSMRDRKNVLHTYTYDQVNRLTQVSAGGVTVSYTYDANGNRLTMVDPTGSTGFTYDSLDRLTRVAYPDTKSVQYAYDKAGNRTSLTYPGGTVTLAYGYDAANRLSQVTQGTLSWVFGYDGAGNRTSLSQPNGTSATYAYLTNNWLSSITHNAPGGAAFQTISYTYDANGNRITQADSSGTTTFDYDPLNRLTQAAYPGAYGTWSWIYDPVGNRTSQTAPGGVTTYTYDQNNRLTQAGVVVYTYDPNGNLTGTTAEQSFTYDPFNRMTQAAGAGGTATYTYNGDGLKIQRLGPDGATRYYHDGFRPIWETDGAGAMNTQLDRDIFGNLLSRQEASGTRRFYHTDGLGSTTALTDEAGGIAASMFYDAWGSVRATSGTGHGKYRFTGAELDTASDLYHMGARFYDPSIGRWLSEDPGQDRYFEPVSLNFYAYVANNPPIFIDPTGLMPVDGGTCDASCRNEKRQQAAKDLLDRLRAAAENSGLTIQEADLIQWGGLILAAAVMAADELAQNMPVSLRRALIQALYIEGYVFIGTSVFAETLRFTFTRGQKNWMNAIWDTAVSPITETGVGLFVIGAYLDAKYFKGDVLREFFGSWY